eukprot:TRINITY_DN45431_c0_g1_i1.p1 TRINITY_DN45431_c0_g1~~TRINITY_DN45431_c0_g1_i1.p1  ORF type:complete len:298 (+),score=36.93 TRINITY_DN45431_c0_g1_i1:235-1128(+)
MYKERRFEGRNVLGVVPGTSDAFKHEAVVIAGHHDHLGERDGEIYNGAVDNCTGVAMMLATARRFVESEQKLARSVLFMAPTAEECGLLGSELYASDPLPLFGKKARPLAAFAFDVGNVWGKTRDISILGYGKSTLDATLEVAAAVQNMCIVPDQQPKMGLFYRSDHWSFVRNSVPGCWFFFGRDFIGKPLSYYEEVVGRYIQSEYHKPADTYRADWSMEGLLSQVDYTVAVTRILGNKTDFYPVVKSVNESTQLLPGVPAIKHARPWRAKQVSQKKGISFGLRCFDCKIEGCVCFL